MLYQQSLFGCAKLTVNLADGRSNRRARDHMFGLIRAVFRSRGRAIAGFCDGGIAPAIVMGARFCGFAAAPVYIFSKLALNRSRK